MWVLDHLEDVDSDMSVFHRVDRPRETLDGPLYFARALRLSAYPGVIQAVVLAEQQRDSPPPTVNVGLPGGASIPGGAPSKVSDSMMLAQLANDGWVDRD